MKKEEFVRLVTQLKKGNSKCLQFIFEDHADFCIKNLIKITKCSLEESEDIFMDSILNFREKAILGKVTHLTNVRNYLYSTCVNMYRVHFTTKMRHLNKKAEVLMFFQPTEAIEELEEGKIYEHTLDVTMESFRALDKKCQEIIKSYYVDEMRMDLIAKKFGFANANVAKTTKSRCFKKWMVAVKSFTIVTEDKSLANGK